MEYLEKLAEKIQSLSKKEGQKYLIISLATTAIIMIAMIYFVHAKSTSLKQHIKRLERLASKSSMIIHRYNTMQDEEERIQKLLDKHKDFNLNSFFEQFYKEQNINPEAGWNSVENKLNPQFSEIELSATFKGQTTEKLVKILEELEKKEIIYIKNVIIKAEKKDKKIAFDITIATLKNR